MATQDSIPVVDLAALSTKDEACGAHLLDQALRTHGFFRVLNHGIKKKTVDGCYEMGHRFFCLPSSEKVRLSLTADELDYGYSGPGEEEVRGQASLKETFDCKYPLSSRWNGLEGWDSPSLPPGFRDSMSNMHQSCSRLLSELLMYASVALGVDLKPHHDTQDFTLSCLRYPEMICESQECDEVIRMPPHSDFGTFTLLFQDSIGGLQFADTSAEPARHNHSSVQAAATTHFAPVNAIDGAEPDIIVLAGYLLMRWTSGAWRNAVHRVVVPPCAYMPAAPPNQKIVVPERNSIAFFASPKASVVIDPISLSPSGQTMKPINVGEYLERKKRQSRRI